MGLIFLVYLIWYQKDLLSPFSHNPVSAEWILTFRIPFALFL